MSGHNRARGFCCIRSFPKCFNHKASHRFLNKLLPFLFVVAGLIGFNSTAWAANNGPQQQAKAQTLTLNLFGLNRAYQNASPEAKAQALDELRSVATERHDLLVDLIENDPAAFSQVTLPADVRAAMPEEVRNFIEQKVELAGELNVFYEDYDNGQHRLRYELEDINSNSRVSLHFEDLPKGLTSGQQVTAHGVFLGLEEGEDTFGVMAVGSDENILFMSNDPASEQTTTSSSSSVEILPNTLGEQRTLVLAVNFANNPTWQPMPLDYVTTTVFTEVNNWIKENSYDQSWLAGDVHGYYTLPIDSTCSVSSIAQYADAAAIEEGVDVASYDRIIYLHAPTNCGWSGNGTVGGSPSRTWINGWLTYPLVAHELGHNYGLHHSHNLYCGGTAPVGDNCTYGEYGDQFDVMGFDDTGLHYNAFQKERLGWLTEAAGDIATIDSDGSFMLEPYETVGGSEAKVLKISRDSTQNNWYYLEYRQALGYDSSLQGNANILNGLLFHTGTAMDADSSMLLDMAPDSSSGLDDAALEAGSSYTDASAGVTIAVGQSDSTGASAYISFDSNSNCSHLTPTVSFVSSASPWVAPGTAVDYSLTVSNNDASICASSTYDLTATIPEGWVSVFSQTSLSLEPGNEATLTLTVISPSDEVDGFYNITASASSGSSGTATAEASYIIEGSNANSAPVAINDDVVLEQISPIIIAVLGNDYDADGDTVSIDTVNQGAKGSVSINGDNTITYTPAKRFKNSDSFSYTISDGRGGFASAMVAISLQTTGSDGGGGGGGNNNGKGKPTK